ncbi:MAG: AAA family ATPase [Firmicutes bacterium]|nr:AAA family ATPase [Bacillota bacterium]
MPRVKVKTVTLSGFGPHRGTVKYLFSDQLNVWVAPNESGKSTLVAGIGAIIFGIPQTTDVTVFGQARYRNWGHPPEFAGELICEVDRETYRIRRDFDSNQVSLAQLTGEQYRELVGGTHNPRAQRRNRHYEETIKSLFGLSSQDLFEATFCLTQPLPEKEEIDEQVQGLLSGTGTGFHLITERLADELRAITRFTRRRGVTAKDATNPRELEELEAQIAQLQQAIMDDRDVVDRLEAIRRELQEQEGLRKEEQKAYHEQDRLLRQWAEWKRLRESYYSAQRFYSQVSKAKEQARKLAEELKQVEQEKQSYSWGPSLPGETGELITELQALQEQRTKLLKRIQELEAQISASIEKEPVSEEEGVSDRLDWGVFGPHPVTVLKRLRRQAEEALTDWANLQQIRVAEQECRTTLDEEFSLFNQEDQATLEAVKSYHDRKARLLSVVESAALKLKNAQTELHKAQRRRIYRLVTALVTAAVTGGLTAWFGGVWGLPALVLSVLGGAGVGYLLGRLCFPADTLALLHHRVTENEQRFVQAQQENAIFAQNVKPFEDQFSDPPGACRRWEQFRAQQEELSAKIQEFSRRELGGFPGPAENCPLAEAAYRMADRWTELRDLAQATEAGAGPQVLGELVSWLQERTPQWWEQLTARAEDYEIKVQAAMEARAKKQVSTEHLAKERGALADLEANEQRTASRISALLAAANGDLEQARRLWLSWRDLVLRTDKFSEALRNIFATQEVDSLEALEGKSDDAALRAQAEYQEWQRLITTHPGLPGTDEVTNLPKIEEDFRR